MTRVLVIGSSHVAAYRSAAHAFADIYPDIQLDFFGVRGPLYLTGKVTKTGVFKVPLRDDKDRTFVMQTNGSLEADTNGYDHLLMVGHRFAFPNFASLLQDHDILEGIRTGKPRLISEAMLKDIIHTVTDAAVADAARAIAHAKAPVTFALAPYPARSIVERRDTYTPARVLEDFWARPDATWVYDIWITHLRPALETKGHHLLEQPNTVSDGPYATKSTYAARAAVLDADATPNTDHRHMNADFGLAMLRHYAETRLKPQPALTAAQTKTTKERIA